MPMVVSDLISRLTAIYLREYSSDSGQVLFSESSLVILPANAAAAWADALASYGSTATAMGSTVVSIAANKEAVAAALLPVFSMQGSPTFATDFFTAVSSLWLAPPVAFVNGGVVTDATIGISPAAASLMSLPPVPDNVSAAVSMAGIVDAYFRTVLVTVPLVPPVVVPLL